MPGWFHNMVAKMQAPMHFSQMSETVQIGVADSDDAMLPKDNSNTTEGIIKVVAEERDTKSGKRYIHRAEVLLRERTPHDSDPVKNLTSVQVLNFRDQNFRIEAIGQFESGYRKVICVATKKEFTNAASLSGGR